MMAVLLLIKLICLLLSGKLASTLSIATAANHPLSDTSNIVLLLADDLGFSDIGTFGSEVSTPNIDALAASGVVFSNDPTAASCAPTRAMLVTGISKHRAGLGNMPESSTPEAADALGYTAIYAKISDRR
ncbi:MAG: arylsulfatase/uncharacterized sulfatase [Candidatus Azotimanducaceae bacterium]|jgi:arylsulfatase/uncharacterized sulfatase